MKRSKHSLSHYHLTTFNMGQLVPVANFEVLAGDSIRMSSSCLMRLSPLMAPVMHPVQVRLHHWFVPYRLIWSDWEDFITGNATPTWPTFNADTVASAAGALGNYLGIPENSENTVTVSALPFRAYNKIWNEFYRDQDLQSELNENTNYTLQRISWEKDYFTSARPWTQKGPDVTLPLTGNAVVQASGTRIPTFDIPGASGVNVSLGSPAGVSTTARWSTSVNGGGAFNAAEWNSPNLEADMSTVSSANVNDVRLAFALQRYQEARAQYGSRYTEYLRYLGIRSSDARLQRPEYLGGGKAIVSFSEVLRTGNSDGAIDDAPIGEMRGHGISAMRTRTWLRFFEEHGVVLTLASVRPRTMYTNGLHRQWSRRVKEDVYQRELERIGQQEVYNREVYSNHSVPGGVFGYQDRYADYRRLPSYVSGYFANTLKDWHFGRIFGTDVTLNSGFIQCDPRVDAFADQTSGAQHLWCMFNHSIQARRLVGNQTIGRIF